jgi:transposase
VLAVPRPLRSLSPVHLRAIQLRLAGYTYDQIAHDVHRSPQTVRTWFLQDSLFRAEYERAKDELIAEALNVLVRAGKQAAERLIALLDHRSGIVALGAARDILDRIGLKPANKTEVSGPDGGPVQVTTWLELVRRADDRADPPCSPPSAG